MRSRTREARINHGAFTICLLTENLRASAPPRAAPAMTGRAGGQLGAKIRIHHGLA